ncbi:hypothetical protein RB195_005857 [Necator americanus]|uniref:C2H2-type domain-containing protein n=1 Tax=Necator americanus TaxID=51031 RepID=A0ABR1BPY5_NECAM
MKKCCRCKATALAIATPMRIDERTVEMYRRHYEESRSSHQPEHNDDMVETGLRGALSGVNELVSFLESASSADRSAFSKRANVILECRTCATLFRKADGFMRHVMRCDSSRAADIDSEADRRSQLTTSATVANAPKVTRVVPLKKPLTNGIVPAPINVESTDSQEQKKITVVRRVGRPPNSEKANLTKLPVKNELTEPISTPPVVAAAGDGESKFSPALQRAQKRPYIKSSKTTTPQKVLKVENIVENSKSAFIESSKSVTSDDVDLSGEVRPSRVRKTPKWLEDNTFSY